ncbi:ABC transporter substrate-binding protein [Cyanobacterium aponinum UTEX 3222]|uniref:Aliphatic sulfonates family ABC transporter, periplasmic ligand-binding protein n=3 Tax=Cyanobacterium aponinum TaxID=379064 RepID=K9Z7Z3_CYAAP|nr:ABC transporter substrate-binding protein [Cyanobacterium aponinum]WRL42716.1 ABC transporter substrate-binding protein [Cyanobacterium aponinum UTEX 3222]AFZ55264.1 aliphatic sulfonates family ABC transporter, periplasmic ligand-binding protein [Cyanobacterium aponinum PCC 10605]MTF39923.1 aliphatic sulfonate ABC transporter substrate-binding protein [Cyanobacterium aponinum 0216]PHV61672.1 aliphatic sulfonates ABC transporter substrate-binding protein [Cyanobacterium aponinum IPPAS B-1201]
MKRKSFLSYLVVFFATLTLAVACNNPASNIDTNTNAGGGTNGETPVRLGFSAWPGWFPWQVAYDQGIFEQNNVNVDLKWFDGYLESINTLIAEQIDANSQTLGDTVSSIAGGADQVIVLVNDNSTGNDKIIVSEEINTIQDLKGKKVAAEEGTVDHFLLLLGMKEAGLSPEDIEFVPLETGSAAAAFVAGQVDAVAVFAPFTTQALTRPNSKELFSSKDFPGSISDHLVFTRKFVEENPEQVQAMVDSWFATMDYIQANPDQANEIMAQRAGVSVDEYEEYAGGTKLFTIEENLEAFTPGDTMKSLYYSAEQMNKFLVDVGLASQEADLSNIFDDRFVKAYAEKKG